MAELETVPAPRTNIGLAGKEGHSKRLRCPPPLEQLGLGASNTMRAGPLKVRVTTSSRSDFRSTVVRFFMGVGSLSLLASIELLLLFQFLNNLVQPVEACEARYTEPHGSVCNTRIGGMQGPYVPGLLIGQPLKCQSGRRGERFWF